MMFALCCCAAHAAAAAARLMREPPSRRPCLHGRRSDGSASESPGKACFTHMSVLGCICLCVLFSCQQAESGTAVMPHCHDCS
jgi:hypothetical protein